MKGFTLSCHPELVSGSSKTGFTLIELLVVVLIIGILSAVALPQYRKAVLKARATEGITLLRSIEKAEDLYFMANGQYTLDLEALDLELPKFNCPLAALCQFYSTGNDFLWEITFSFNNRNAPSHYTLYCAAKTADASAKQICASLGSYSHNNGGRSYYAIVRK